MALVKIRSFAQFLDKKKRNGLLHIADPEFGGQPNGKWMRKYDRISKYVCHISEQRWKKDEKYEQSKAMEALRDGSAILGIIKAVMDDKKPKFKGDAGRWYCVFEYRYKELMSNQ